MWNDDSPTYIRPATRALTSINLTMCSPQLYLSYSWEVEEDQWGIDHFPFILKGHFDPSQNYTDTFQRIKARKERQPLNFHSHNDEEYNKLSTIEELKTALKKSHDTTPCPDEIHYQILKHLPDLALENLFSIFNHIWESGDFPSSWKEAMIIPIPKPGKDDTNANNYRPIALTSCVCKTMERMINERLIWYIETAAMITIFQSGFRKTRSTIDHLVRLETFIREGFIKQEHVVSIFFDLEKAYDTTWKYGILSDLHQMGLRGRLPIFIDNFLSDRCFRVRVGTSLSDSFDQEQGVLQGSILSVTLFIIKINTIVSCVFVLVQIAPYLLMILTFVIGLRIWHQ